MTAFGQRAALQAIKVQRIGFRHGTRFEAVKARPGALPFRSELVLSFQQRYFVFYSQFLAFKFVEEKIVGVRPLIFFIDFVFERQVFDSQSFDVLLNRHLRPPQARRYGDMVTLHAPICQANRQGAGDKIES